MSYHDGRRPYKGGIQPGTTASSPQSEELDDQVRQISKIVYDKLKPKYPELERLYKMPKRMLFEGIGACAPDGGVWTYKNKFVAAFEGKHQGLSGNAIERWFKNYHHIIDNSPRCPLVTFATGPGVRRGEYNTIRQGGPSVFLSELGFSNQFVEEVMMHFIEDEIRRLNP